MKPYMMILSAFALAAQADMVLEKRDIKDGAWCVNGLKDGTYYIQLETAENDLALTHAGRYVNFTHAGVWSERGNMNVRIKESDPVEVKDGDIFCLQPVNPYARLILSEKPLAYAPQKIHTREIYTEPKFYDIQATYADGVFSPVVKTRTNVRAKAKVSVMIRDYWQRELARVDNAEADLFAPFTLDVPFTDTKSGQLWAHVTVVDGEGRKSERIFPKVVNASNGFRETIPLNEGWERCGTKDDGSLESRTMSVDPPANAKWEKVEMPACIKYPVTWFRSEREIPASFDGKKVFFRTFRLLGRADLYVDGVLAASFGKDFNFVGAQEADITAAVKPGKKQQFLIVGQISTYAVLPPEELAKKNPDFNKSLAFDCSGKDRSAFSEMMLEARPVVSIGDVHVITSFRDKKITVKADVPEGYTTRNTVLRQGQTQLSFANEAKWKNPILWGPTEFPLLQLKSELLDAKGAVVDVKDTRFGFREFWTDEMKFMWNGKQVKGDARAFLSTWGSSFDTRNKRQNNVDIMLTVKNRGSRFVRHLYNADEMIDILDELGILAANGGETIAGPSPEKSARTEWWKTKELNDREMIRTRFNHPSVLCWYLTNEYYGFSDDRHHIPCKSAVRQAAALDPTRFAEAGCDLDLRGEMKIVSTHYPVEVHAFRSGDAYMPYCFYWRPVNEMFTPDCMVPYGQVKSVCNVAEKSAITWGHKPIFVNETGWEHFYAPPFGYTRIAGDEVFNDTSYLEKWHVATELEYIKGHRDADVTLWTPWRWYTVDLARYASPDVDVVNIQRYTRFYEGEKVSYDVNCFYDKLQSEKLKWFWRIVGYDRKRLVREGDSDTHRVDFSALLRKKIEFKAPKAGLYRLQFGIEGLCEKELVIRTFEQIVDAKSSSRQNKEGEQSITRDETSRVRNVIAGYEPLSTNLLARAAAGETIVLLARDDYPDWLPEVPKYGDISAAILRTYRPDHPILKGISAEDLQYFYPNSIASKHSFAKPTAGNAKTVIEHGGPSGLIYSSLVEVPYGKGCFLYSRLVLEPEKNPIAAQLLGNMASYKRTTAPGTALYLAGNNAKLEKALRVRCGVVMEAGELKDVAQYAAVFVDGSRKFTDEDLKALENCGKPVLFFVDAKSSSRQDKESNVLLTRDGTSRVQTRPVKAQAVQGRAVLVGRDPLFDGLTNQDMMWRGKYAEYKTAIANLGPEEFVTEDGALTYPAYFVRRGNIVYTTADPDVHHPSVNSLARRFWSTVIANTGVMDKAFERPTLPKNLFYNSVDLTPYLDRTLEDVQADDGLGSWNDQGMEQYLTMKFKHPTGWVGMVPYDVKQKGPCAFALNTEHRKGGVSNVTVKVGRTADTVNWLYSSVWTGKDKLHYTVRLDYTDGTSFTAEGRGGINTFDCFTPNPNFAEESDTITSFKSFPTTNRVFTVANVYSTTVVNPNPKKVIDTITFSRGEKRCARIGVFALTLGSKDSGVAPMSVADRKAKHEQLVADAMAATKAKDIEKAIALYEEALRVDPMVLGVYRSLGTIYETEKNWYDALVTYQRSLAADYNQPDVWESEKQMKAKLGVK